MGHKCKKAIFRKACKPFSMLHGELMYNNISLVISSTARQHTIISDDLKAKATALCNGFSDTKDFKQIFLAQYQRRCRRIF